MNFNSFDFSFSDVTVIFKGRSVIGLHGVRYKVMQTKTNLYGRGKKPVARTRGKLEYEGEIVLSQHELETMQLSMGKGNTPLDIPPFDIVVSYDKLGDGVLKVDTLKGCEFTEIEKSLSRDDDEMSITLPLIIADIEFGV